MAYKAFAESEIQPRPFVEEIGISISEDSPCASHVHLLTGIRSLGKIDVRKPNTLASFNEIDLKEIKASFLQDQVAWIFYPVSVEILASSAGDEYNIIKTFIHKTKQNLTQEIKFFTTSLPDEKIRFIKIRAKSQGECPSWHPGNGGPAWIFVDEIVVQ